jgi:photosystem II stability/assembly factor-like uncharacterized protein
MKTIAMKRTNITTKTLLFLLLALAGTAKAQQWKELHTGVTEDLYDVCCIDDNTIFVCGQNSVILKSTNGGDSWVEKYRRAGCQMTEICFADENNGYAVCDTTLDDYSHQWFLVKTSDGGETWDEVGNPVHSWIESYTALSRQFVRVELFLNDADKLVVAVSFDGIYRSTDGGATMRKLDNDFTINETRGIFFEDNVGYLLWDYGEEDLIFPGERYAGVAKTEDYGESWNHLENISNITDGMAFARFYDKNHIRLFGNFINSENDYKGRLETYDGFDTFEVTGNGFGYLQFVEIYIRARFTENGWGMSMLWENDMPGVGRGISYTEDDGITWTSYSGYGLPIYRFYDIDGIDSTFYISSENGIVLKNRQFTLMGSEETSSDAITVYPNPTNDAILICGENVSVIELYSVHGTCLLKKQINDQRIKYIDIYDFKPGIYYVRIIDEQGKSVINKLIKE